MTYGKYPIGTFHRSRQHESANEGQCRMINDLDKAMRQRYLDIAMKQRYLDNAMRQYCETMLCGKCYETTLSRQCRMIGIVLIEFLDLVGEHISN
ncbi:hypothetical protein CDAR_379801 [Caerostris darwini]|uniref:Uncharacterized protein n=1 Tax=Caerostris darwini TaxID=1538125 RepID=A0AAV4PSI5_9ARAC|nr:hypothetical protein CDAR_379801 [Caerostris darwini]